VTPTATHAQTSPCVQDYEEHAEDSADVSSKGPASARLSNSLSSNSSLSYGLEHGVAATLPATMKQALKEAQRDASIRVTFGDRLTGAFKMVYVDPPPPPPTFPCSLANVATRPFSVGKVTSPPSHRPRLTCQ
jgi:hypothetical protein